MEIGDGSTEPEWKPLGGGQSAELTKHQEEGQLYFCG